MIKCVYNGVKPRQNLVRRKKPTQFSDLSNRWGCHTQRQDKSSIAKSLFLSLLLKCKE